MSSMTPRSITHAQDRLLQLLGSSIEGRSVLVANMLHRGATEATSYWFQLVVSVGIATLGLVVGSTAVIIGAMLVAPLMGPIIGLAMGLATGSPFLVLRAAGRILFSMVVVIGGAALITLTLPFHEMNAEIAGRTSPTVLDLVTAAFCALAGVYATLRPASDATTTAAGTSIGISLVPPLCASGYGLGTLAWPVAGGALLLFLTNMVAIVVVGTVAFVGVGFNRVDVVTLESDELGKAGEGARIARELARRLSSLFASRFGPVLRFLMPFLLLGVLYIPLRRALNEVAWEVRVRAAVQASIAREPLRVVQTRVRVERHEVEVVLVLLGTTQDADTTRARMEGELRDASGVAPHLEIFAIPDATAFAGLESTLLTPHVIATATAKPLSPDEQLEAARGRIRSALDALWPKTAVGAPMVIDVGTAEENLLRIRVVHLGQPLGDAAVESFQQSLSSTLKRPVQLVDVAVPPLALTRHEGDLPFIAQVASAARATAGIADVHVCVVRPADPTPGRRSPAAELELAHAVDDALAIQPRVTLTSRGPWSVLFMQGQCEPVSTSDAGVPWTDAGAQDAGK